MVRAFLLGRAVPDGFVDDASLQGPIDEAKSLAKIIKPINPSDIVDYSFLRAAVKTK